MSNKEKYRQFCKTEMGLPIFVKDWYLDAVCIEGEWDVILIENETEILAALPYFHKKKAGFHYIIMPPFVKMMGPYLTSSGRNHKNPHRLYQQLIEKLPSLDGFKQDFHPAIKNWLPFYWKGYHSTTRYTYVIDLKNSLEQIYADLNRNMKRNIKKASTQLRIETNHSLTKFYELNQMSFDRQSVKIPYSFDVLEKHYQTLREQDAVRLFFAVDDQGQMHSAAFLIWDEKRAYYHLSGDAPHLRKSGSGIFLIWEAIKFAKEKLEVEYFDFEGSMMENVEQIRRQYGAVQEPYFRVWKYHNRLYQLLDFKWRP